MRIPVVLLVMAMQSVSAAEDKPAAAVSALWKAMSHEADGRADVATMRRLFHEDAVIFGGRYRDGVPSLRRTEAADFIAPQERVQAKGFHECEIARSLQVYDRFAVAYSVVESRADASAASPDFVGVNSVQLYQVGAQWKIVSLYYHVEKPGEPIAAEGGRSGQCLD